MEPDYDSRYLAGVLLFNRREFFLAHEAWEAVWNDCPAAERRYVQGLIQAAVALYHYGRGNPSGATRLFRSARDYMRPYAPTFGGVDVDAFWQAMERCFAPLFDAPADARLDPSRIPVLTLTPEPVNWPDPAAVLAALDP